MSECPQCGNSFEQSYSSKNLVMMNVSDAEQVCYSPESSQENKVYIHREVAE